MAEFNPRESAQPSEIRTGVSEVRLSMLAVTAAGLALLGVLLLPGYLWTFRKSVPPFLTPRSYTCILLSVSFLAAVLGLISAGRIALSGGRLTGRAFAWIGVGAPVIQLLLFLMLILPRVPRSIAFRMTCGTNLSGIGKAMLIYANDYEDELPRAGSAQSPWAARIADWKASHHDAAYGIDPVRGTEGRASISASLYLLVKYGDVEPKAFVCARGEPKTKPFDPARYAVHGRTLADLWDFGPDPPRHVSYAYQQVYGPDRPTCDGDPGMAILADRNPWIDSPFGKASVFSEFLPDVAPFNGTVKSALCGNTRAHGGDGQNVLFLDTHVEFAKRASCAIDDDNIYTSWHGADKVRGLPAQFGRAPAGPTDSLLVHDPPVPRKP